MTALTLDHVMQVHPRVSVRPEPFGALLYHFGTRQLSFLKDLTLLAVIRELDGVKPLGVALDNVGVSLDHHARYLRALSTLASSNMLEYTAAGEVAA